MKKETYIGIDPGTNTGVAVWCSEHKRFDAIMSGKIHILLDEVYVYHFLKQAQGHKVFIFCENPNTWVPMRGRMSQKEFDSRKKGAGSVMRDFAIWKDFCEDHDMEFVPKSIRGTKKKVDAAFFKKLTGWQKRTSKDSRDAAMMVFKM